MANPSIATIDSIEELKKLCPITGTWTIFDVIEDPKSVTFAVQGSWFISLWLRMGMPLMPAVKVLTDDNSVIDSVWLFPLKYDKCRIVWIAFNKGQATTSELETAIKDCWIADIKVLREDFIERLNLHRGAMAEKQRLEAAYKQAEEAEIRGMEAKQKALNHFRHLFLEELHKWSNSDFPEAK